MGFGLGATPLGGYPNLGIVPEANDAFGIHELDESDPITPRAFFVGPPVYQNTTAYRFGPAITSVAQATPMASDSCLNQGAAPGLLGPTTTGRSTSRPCTEFLELEQRRSLPPRPTGRYHRQLRRARQFGSAILTPRVGGLPPDVRALKCSASD